MDSVKQENMKAKKTIDYYWADPDAEYVNLFTVYTLRSTL